MSGGLSIGSALGGFNPLSPIGIGGGIASSGVGGLGDDLLGLGLGTPSQSITRPFFGGTQYSNVTDGIVNLDPSIRNLQTQGIGTLNDGLRTLGQATGQFGTNLGQLRQSLLGNQGAFLQARTAPTERLFSEQRGQLAQSLGRRGLGGSSIAERALTRQALDQTGALADQRSLALQESIGAGLNIEQMLLNAAQAEAQGNLSMANYLRGLASDRANLEAGLLTASGTNSTGSQPGLLSQLNVALPVG